ncbi:hypothetical protein LCGC14_0542540 [marine sediment metagenome]|uniref:Uncharacterized protein n=1 Tax=marine sediment metagenome TaxID=412755 RepID=A0A0F9RX65_9ZZZZ
MATYRRRQYLEEVEKAAARGKSPAIQHKTASQLSSIISPLGKPDKFDKPSLVDKFILKRLRRKKVKDEKGAIKYLEARKRKKLRRKK